MHVTEKWRIMRERFRTTQIVRRGLTLFVLSWVQIALSQTGDPDFGQRADRGLIQNDQITEASGLAASRKQLGVLWTHNDSGDESRIFVLNSAGVHLGIVRLVGVSARDWEDIAIGPGPDPGTDYLYIGDFGDNNALFDLKTIYRLREPEYHANQAVRDTAITDFDAITFRYPDGKRDVESLLIDPLTRDIYVVSKREAQVGVYRLAFPQSTTDVTVAERVAALNMTYVVGGDISASGLEIVIKTYTEIFYWKRERTQQVWQAFATVPVKVPYTPEPQGEAVCWAGDDSGYFTTSEEYQNIPARLYFYPRKSATAVKRHETGAASFRLEQYFPNPFNPRTRIDYSLTTPAVVSLKVYDLLGNELATLADGFRAARESRRKARRFLLAKSSLELFR